MRLTLQRSLQSARRGHDKYLHLTILTLPVTVNTKFYNSSEMSPVREMFCEHSPNLFLCYTYRIALFVNVKGIHLCE